MSHRLQRRAFTLLELIVVVALIAILISLLLPGIQQARELARLTECRNNLMQIGVALHNYNVTHGVLPSGCVNSTGPVTNAQLGYKMSWIAQILPYLGHQNIWMRIDFDHPPASFGAAAKPPEPQKTIGGELWSWDDPDGRNRRQEELAKQLARLGNGQGSDDVEVDENEEADTSAEEGETPESSAIVWKSVVDAWYDVDVIPVSILRCSSSPNPGTGITVRGPGVSDYAGCLGGGATEIDTSSNGLLYLNSSESVDDVPDGASCTLLVGEKPPSMVDNGWIAGDYSTLRAAEMQVVSGMVTWANPYDAVNQSEALEEGLKPEPFFGAYHSLTLNFLMADGSVCGIRHGVSQDLLERLGSRNDGSLISDGEF